MVFGPLALLALLFPVAFGTLAALRRRWLVLFSVVGINSTIYLGHAWLRGYLTDSWWGQPRALLVTLALVSLAGVIWSWRRHRQALRSQPGNSGVRPPRGEQLLLSVAGLAALVLAGYILASGSLLTPPWKDLLAIFVAVWVGAAYTLYLRVTTGNRPGISRLPSMEGVMLLASAGAYAGLAAVGARVEPSPGIAVVWTFAPPARGAIISSPVVTADQVYVAGIRNVALSTTGVLYCLDRHTGKIRWQFDAGGTMQPVYSTPCLADGRLYLGEGLHTSQGCRLFCLDALSGWELWHFETAGHVESSPCVADGRVFFGAGDDGVYGLDARTGKECWHFQGPFHVDTSASVAGDHLYIGSGVSRTHRATEVFCLGVLDGRVVWRVPTNLPVWGSPVVDGDQVLVGLGNGNLLGSVAPPERPAGAVLCLDARTGQRRWRYDVGDGVLARPTADDRRVYVGARDGFCYALDRGDGQRAWEAHLGSAVVSRPALVGRRLYVAAVGGRVSCLDTDRGSVHWTFDVAGYSGTRSQLVSSPAVVPAGEGMDGHQRIFVGAELQTGVGSAAALYCLQD
jgi:outer membrane protein assembly factor BamB